MERKESFSSTSEKRTVSEEFIEKKENTCSERRGKELVNEESLDRNISEEINLPFPNAISTKKDSFVKNFDRSNEEVMMLFAGIKHFKRTNVKTHYIGFVLFNSLYTTAMEVPDIFHARSRLLAILSLLNFPNPPQRICLHDSGMMFNEKRYSDNLMKKKCQRLGGDNIFDFEEEVGCSEVSVILQMFS